LDTSQRALAGARIKHLFEQAARERQEATRLAGRAPDGAPVKASASAEMRAPTEPKKAAADAAAVVNVSPRSGVQDICIAPRNPPGLS
jgi:hypothetical protein